MENDFRKQSLSKISFKMTSKMERLDHASFCFENRAQDAPKTRQDAPRCPKTPQNSSKIPPKTPRRRPKMRPGRLQEAPRGSKRLQDAPRRTQGAARHPQDVPRRLQDTILVGLGSQTGTKLAAQEPPKPIQTLILNSFGGDFGQSYV